MSFSNEKHTQQATQQQNEILPQRTSSQHASVPALAPLPPPGIFCLPQCVAHEPTAVVLRDTFSFRGAAGITDIDGKMMFRLRQKAFSMSKRKEVFDAQGQLLFTIRAESLSTFYCETPSGHRFLDISGDWKVLKPKSEVSFINNANGEQLKIQFLGNHRDTHSDVKLDDGTVVCTIDRNRRSVFGGASTYVLTVAPGMDISICVAMFIVMDQRMNNMRGAAAAMVMR